MHSADQAARIAGAWFLSLALTAPVAVLYVPAKIIVRDYAVATVSKLDQM